MSAFSNLKNNKTNALAGLQKQVQQKADEASGGGSRDPRFWKLSYNKDTKIGSATIRFLPFGAGVRLPWVEWIEYSFKGKGGNYWERSLKAIGKDDPVAELNSQQWERGAGGDKGPDKTAVRSRGRRLRYVSNILVVNDPAHPENNGKNFLFEYGPAIHKKVMAAMVPEYADQALVQVYDLWQGANFKVRTKDKSGYLNYDDSGFDAAAPLHDNDELLEKWFNAMMPLEEFEAEDKYKTYEELETQMIKVLGAHYVAGIRGEQVDVEQAAGVGANPFAAQQQAGVGANPFANQGQQPVQQAPATDDPFANQGQQPVQQQVNDPFAGGTAPATDDPFANMEI